MKFQYTILYVDNVRNSVDFYQRAFGIKAELVHESGDYAQLSTGDTKLAMASRSLIEALGKRPRQAEPDAPSFEIALETDDVAGSVAAAIAAGATLQQPVREESWGQSTAYVSDPDGYLVEICSPVPAA